MVWATASFDNSHKEYLTQEDFNSLENALCGAKLLVKTEKLWENTRTYIWRNRSGPKVMEQSFP